MVNIRRFLIKFPDKEQFFERNQITEMKLIIDMSICIQNKTYKILFIFIELFFKNN
jgi:hypothetical protein